LLETSWKNDAEWLPAAHFWLYSIKMDSEIDIVMSARLLTEQHGEKAAEIAAQGEYEMLERGDEKGAAIWNRIIAVVSRGWETVDIEFPEDGKRLI
jgi:hypothetical protein